MLFDEIEKAHSDVFNMLLQILEDGQLTDSQGRKVDFKNSIIIMTSNVGARLITEKQNSLGFGTSDDGKADKEKLNETVMAELKKTFKPEFLNRVDDIIVFNKLTNKDIEAIAQRMLKDIKNRVASLGIEVEFTNKAIKAIAAEGFDESYGARPLRRAIQSKIENTLSEDILSGSVKSGDSVICDYKNKKFEFQVKKS